jgi:23S rRNA pseudouridine955/2504/2580 synthase
MDVDAEGKDALTHFRLLQSCADASYVEAEIFTGRTHQIRVHAAHLGLPLAGDNRYSSEDSQKKWKARGLNRLFLHAHHLVFTSLSGDNIECHAPLPAALGTVLDAIEI